ncbi:MAG: hypothetical protein Alis3KO_38130 [Aliiglaciecola sp.]
MQNIRSKLLKASIAVSSVFLFSLSSQALMVYQSAAVNVQDDKQSIEIITITGERSLAFFRQQFVQTQKDFFDAINALQLDDSYEISCERKTNSFSRIKRKVCEPKYVEEIRYDLTQQAIGDRAELDKNLNRLVSDGVLQNSVNAKRKIHLAALSKAIRNNPDLQQKLLNLNKARYSLEQKKVEVFGKSLAATSVEDVLETSEFVDN